MKRSTVKMAKDMGMLAVEVAFSVEGKTTTTEWIVETVADAIYMTSRQHRDPNILRLEGWHVSEDGHRLDHEAGATITVVKVAGHCLSAIAA